MSGTGRIKEYDVGQLGGSGSRLHRGPFSPPGWTRPTPVSDLSPGRVIVESDVGEFRNHAHGRS